MLERVINVNNSTYHVKPPMTANSYGDRVFFFPFLTGALVGGAAVGLTRPRPIYNVAPYPNYGPRPPYYSPGAPYSYSSYGGYIPGPYGY